jgi:hypothetical protein
MNGVCVDLIDSFGAGVIAGMPKCGTNIKF